MLSDFRFLPKILLRFAFTICQLILLLVDILSDSLLFSCDDIFFANQVV